MLVSAIEGHRIWAESYDASLNPVLALEARTLRKRLQQLPPASFLDVASGTGRWMGYLRALGHSAFGIDLCPEMVSAAKGKSFCTGRLTIGDLRELPFRDGAFECVLCSFALGYVDNMADSLRELARVSARVIVSDLHPNAIAAGWTRSFRAAGVLYELEHYTHSLADLQQAAAPAGLVAEWSTEAYFAAPEREIFAAAGKESRFDAASSVPAVVICAWAKP